jgi:RimJ/RimL family protein N-acetyltransferase
MLWKERNIMVTVLSSNPRPLANGATLKVRPLRAGDALLLQDLYQRLSPTTLYSRYFRPYQPPLAELQQICQLRADEGAGVIALVERPQVQVIGFAQYLINQRQPATAEVGFLVEDRFQGQGVGRTLFQHLAQRATRQGIQTFTAYVQPDNNAMLRLFRQSGLPVTVQFADGLHEVRISLATTVAIPRHFARHEQGSVQAQKVPVR